MLDEHKYMIGAGCQEHAAYIEGIHNHWIFDVGDGPSVGHDGPDEHLHMPMPQVSPPRGGL